MKSEVQRLFIAALDLPEDQQAQFVASQTNDAELCREVLSLLKHDRVAEPFFADAMQFAASSLRLSFDLQPGARLGAYLIERTLGRGGMGAVYLASRADGAFEQRAAIKVIHASNSLPFLRERFRQERQILARLNHPNIARLLDGGESEAGFLYFVLEYVAGQDIEQYCESHGLGLRSRLELFLQICSAVHYAHENLVIHRDLKPGNILVGEDGIPKLLDFGIAKVLEPFETGPANPSTRLFTLEYASPEQIRGGAITTASDVYSLGAVLYQLLTHSRLRVLRDLSPKELVRVISEEAPPVATGVPQEVAAILQKALHLDPARRYRSAHDLASDIGRFLDGQPVAAVPDSLGYRVRTFLRRNWIPSTAVLAVAVALAGGTGVALWQARRAERRFADVRQLSNRFLFDFENAIHNVAGTTKARELVISTAQEYLDRLAKEAGRDPELTRELADSYKKLGDVEGSPLQGNTGNTKAALAGYRKALELRDSLGDSQSPVTKVRVAYLQALSDLGVAETIAGDAAAGARLSEKAVTISQAWVSQISLNEEPLGFDFLLAAANAYNDVISRQMDRGEFVAAMATARKSLELKQRAAALEPANGAGVRALATGFWSVAAAERQAGESQAAVADFGKAVELMRQLSDADPANSSKRRELVAANWQLASSTKDWLRQQKKDVALALPRFEETFNLARQLMQDDPANALVEQDVAGIALAYGSTLQQTGKPRESLGVLLPVMEMQHRRFLMSPGSRNVSYNLALLTMWAADCRKDLHDLPGALQHRRSAMDLLERVAVSNPSNYAYAHQRAHNLRETGDLLAAQGDTATARKYYRAGLEIAEKLPAGPAHLDRSELIAELHEAENRIGR